VLRLRRSGFEYRNPVGVSQRAQEGIMKKFINRTENAFEEMLRGFAVLSPNTARLSGH
jgi:hypothetical protein